jgi:hypothetical protein
MRLRSLPVVLCLFVVSLFVVSLFASTAFAQETTAGLQGTVTDPSGAVVSNAQVALTGTTLVGGKQQATDGSGYFRFANLPPGDYVVKVSANGFKTLKREGLTLEIGHLPTLDLKLEVGTSETVVEVSGAAPVIDVTTTRNMTNITEDVISDVPHGRSFQSVIQFAPMARNEPLEGAQGNGFSGTGGCSPSGCSNGQSAGYSVGGASDSENSYLVEGQETANIIGGYSHSNVPFDFIQEVQVKTSGVEAEHGGALGGVVNVVMKKGSNGYHGSIFTQFENDAMDGHPNAFSRYDPLDSGNPALGIDPAYQNYQPIKPRTSDVFPGGTFGGPLIKDRIWFFVAFNPELARLQRTVDFSDQGLGVLNFSQNTNTYYTNARIDASVTEKVRVFGSWLYQYQRQTGESLPNSDSTTGFFNPSATVPVIAFGHNLGYSAPNNTTNVGADITINPRVVATTRFGYFFENYHDFGYPTTGTTDYWEANGVGANIVCATPPCPMVPANLQHATGYFNAPQNINTTFRNANKHIQLDQDVAVFKSGWKGTHNIKFGYQLNRVSTDISQRYNQPFMEIFPGSANTYFAAGSTGFANCAALVATYGPAYGDPAGSNCTGTYGYANVVDYGSLGKATSYNHGLFVQDAWTIGRGITINAGVRVEKEYIPAEPQLGLLSNAPGPTGGTVTEPNTPINFGWGDKIAPRFGAAWDVFKDGRMKVFGSYGVFNDIMKLNLAISSFGGQYWQQCAYALMSPNAVSQLVVTPNSLNRYCTGNSAGEASLVGGSPQPGLIFLENVNERVLETVVPHLKPYRQHESVFGVDYQLKRHLAFEARWDRRRLDHLIEDAALFTPSGAEVYQIVNPGFGPNQVNALCATAGSFNGTPYAACPRQPPGARSYDGVELRLTKTTSDHWYSMFSYTYSHLRGNYTGLTSTDIADAGGGRNSPDNSRAFDETYFSFDAYGRSSSGDLPTDRPNTFKGYAYYELGWKEKWTTDLGLFQVIYQGSPVSSYIDVGYSVIPGNFFAQYVEGKGKWADVTGSFGDLSVPDVYARRTPWYTQTDSNFTQNYRISETKVLSFSAIIPNLLNQRAVTAYNEQIDSGQFSSFLAPGGVPFYYGGIAYSNYEHPYNWKSLLNTDGIIPDSQYGKPYLYQVARNIRLVAKYTF